MLRETIVIYGKMSNNLSFFYSPEQVKELTSNMIGKVLITKQTGAAGKICNSVMVTARMFPRKEHYMAVMLESAFDVCTCKLKIIPSSEIVNQSPFYSLQGARVNCFQTRRRKHRGDRRRQSRSRNIHTDRHK